MLKQQLITCNYCTYDSYISMYYKQSLLCTTPLFFFYHCFNIIYLLIVSKLSLFTFDTSLVLEGRQFFFVYNVIFILCNKKWIIYKKKKKILTFVN